MALLYLHWCPLGIDNWHADCTPGPSKAIPSMSPQSTVYFATGDRAHKGPTLIINGTDLAAGPKFLSFLPRKPQPSPAALVRSQVNIVVKQGIKEAQVYTLESVEPQC